MLWQHDTVRSSLTCLFVDGWDVYLMQICGEELRLRTQSVGMGLNKTLAVEDERGYLGEDWFGGSSNGLPVPVRRQHSDAAC